MSQEVESEKSGDALENQPESKPLNIESGLDALRYSREFQGPVEPLDGIDDQKTCEHIALFYETRDEQLAAVVPFITQGIQRGERVMYVVDEHARDDLVEALQEGPADVDQALETGQLTFHTLEETYLRNGYFDADEMITFYRNAIEEATTEYPALRVTAGTNWILDDETTIEDFLEYESRVNELFEAEDSIALCHYDCQTIPSDILTKIIRTHPHLIYDDTVCHNFYFTPPEDFLEPGIADQQVDQMLGTLVDRTQARAELKDTVKELEESNERLKRFAYIASHDLQEPLRMVSSYLQLLENRHADDLDADAQEYVEYAVDGADRMREMVEGLLNYSRVDMEDTEYEPVDINETLNNVIADLELQIKENDATVEIDELPTVVGDANLLTQVFNNLISNALKYNGDESPHIEIGADRHCNRYVFSVSDNGIGINPVYADQIFEVFNRLHSHDEYPGTGIGLALCRKIIQHHGGDIWVDSEPGVGTTFYFSLPREGSGNV